MGLIPTGQDITGSTMAFRLSRKVELASCTQTIDFGALLDRKTTIQGQEFPYTGWIGEAGKTDPIVATFDPNPGMSKSGENEKPSFHIYVETKERTLLEIAVAFKKEAKNSKSTYYSGQTVGTPTINFLIFPHVPKGQTAEQIQPEDCYEGGV